MSISRLSLTAFCPKIGLNDTKSLFNSNDNEPLSQSQNSIIEISNDFFCLCCCLTSLSTIFQPCRDGATASKVLPVLSGSKVSCATTQHGRGSFQTPYPTLRSPTLYHLATALPLSEISIATTTITKFQNLMVR